MRKLALALAANLVCSLALATDDEETQGTKEACFVIMAPYEKPGTTFSMVAPPSGDLVARVAKACKDAHGECSWLVDLSYCGLLRQPKDTWDIQRFEEKRPILSRN